MTSQVTGTVVGTGARQSATHMGPGDGPPRAPSVGNPTECDRFGAGRPGSDPTRPTSHARVAAPLPVTGRGGRCQALGVTSGPQSPGALLAAALRRAPAAPLITYYDDATGERVELSAATLSNWVAKTANLLQDEADVGPGSTVAVAMPVHWQTAAVLLAAWSCGATVLETAVEDDDRLDRADVVLAEQGRLEAIESVVTGELFGLSLHPLGLGMVGYVGTARDLALEARVQGDVFTPHQAIDPQAPGLVAGALELTLAGLVEVATVLAGRVGIVAGDRLLIDDRTAAEAGSVAWLLAPLAAGASIVLCRNADPGVLTDRAASERVTAAYARQIPGTRTLGQPGDAETGPAPADGGAA